MHGLLLEREARRRLARAAVGDDPLAPRFLTGQVEARGREARILSLPSMAGPAIQDYTTGQFFYMVDVSPIDGPDSIQ